MTRVRHPQPSVIKAELERLIRFLDTYAHHDRLAAKKACCTCVMCLAERLASRGYPTNTAGGIRGSDSTSSTERAAGVLSETTQLAPPPFAGIDEDVAKLMRIVFRAAVNIQSTGIRVMSHGTDDDPVPAGTGSCQCCTKFCRPDADHPDNRIKAGYCDSCWRRWVRQGKPDRSKFERLWKEETAA